MIQHVFQRVVAALLLVQAQTGWAEAYDESLNLMAEANSLADGYPLWALWGGAALLMVMLLLLLASIFDPRRVDTVAQEWAGMPPHHLEELFYKVKIKGKLQSGAGYLHALHPRRVELLSAIPWPKGLMLDIIVDIGEPGQSKERHLVGRVRACRSLGERHGWYLLQVRLRADEATTGSSDEVLRYLMARHAPA